MRTTWNLFAASLKMLLRDRPALVGTVALPILFVAVFSMFDLTLAPGGVVAVGSGGGVDYFDYVLPGLLALGLMNFTMVGMAGSVARFRETRILRRLTATPVSPSSFIVAQVAARLVLALAQVALLLGLGLLLGGTVHGNPLWLLVLGTLGNLIFLNLGLAVAGRTSSVDAANNLAGLATAPLMFLSGMFFPLDSLPAVARGIGQVLPITPLVDAMRAVSLDGAGPGQVRGDALYLVGWVALSFLLARLTFRMSRA